MFSFTADPEHNSKHNELYRDSSRIGRAAFIFAAVLLVFAFIITRVYAVSYTHLTLPTNREV